MENKDIVIPLISVENERARNERLVKRLIVALIISIMLIFATNAIWLISWCQYDYTSETSQSESVVIDGKDGVASYIGNNGEINNG